MPSLRILVLTLIAALFAVSGVARAAPMPASQPPCHEAPADHGKSTPVQAAMTCCVGCMPAPTETALVLAVSPAEPARYVRADLALEGRLTAPDPPRLHV